MPDDDQFPGFVADGLPDDLRVFEGAGRVVLDRQVRSDRPMPPRGQLPDEQVPGAPAAAAAVDQGEEGHIPASMAPAPRARFLEKAQCATPACAAPPMVDRFLRVRKP